jgi:hypothetical protein
MPKAYCRTGGNRVASMKLAVLRSSVDNESPVDNA